VIQPNLQRSPFRFFLFAANPHSSFFLSCTNFFHTMQRFPLSGQTFFLSNCLSTGPVGPLVYLHSLSMPRKQSWIESSSGYCLSPQWPVKESQLVGSLGKKTSGQSVFGFRGRITVTRYLTYSEL
jgi:hypothetical protein